MDVVALVSGGKDSCFSILKARAFGYRVIALAHILPPCEEPDSMMYQSVGSTAVPCIAEALNLPLLTRRTEAKAKSTDLNYRISDGDEVEDLYNLLCLVKIQFPSIQAVTSGALWSDYQRLRVEHAASRAGLLSIAPLWRRNQPELLNEMIDCGIDAVLVKVAGVGLHKVHLGKSLVDMRPLLLKLENDYGSHVCGEGGEYETFVRWMPGFSKRINLDVTEIVLHSSDPVAPVSYLRLKSFSLTTVDPSSHNDYQAVVCRKSQVFNFPEPSPQGNEKSGGVQEQYGCDFQCRSIPVDRTQNIDKSSDIQYLTLTSVNDGPDGVRGVCRQLREYLSQMNLSLKHVASVQLYLTKVLGVSYKEANTAYNETFGSKEVIVPPVRACVGISGAGSGTTMEVIVRRGERDNAFALHVQSLSEWAPPCIGPYAQFIEEDGLVFVSGVLPLLPPTANVPDGMPFGAQTIACFDNMRRTLEAGHSGIENIGIFIIYISKSVTTGEMNNVMTKLEDDINPESIKVMLPVDSLPKGALVEVKGVGVLHRDDMSQHKRLVSKSRMEFESISCGTFTFVVVKCASNKTTSEQIQTVIDDVVSDRYDDDNDGDKNVPRPLSVQLFCRENSLENVTNEEQKEIARKIRDGIVATSAATRKGADSINMSVFTSRWMPHETYWIAIITFVSSSKLSSSD